MVERLFVIIGAGASRGCAPDVVGRNLSQTPPLVPDLFDATFAPATNALPSYPLVKLAAADLRGLDTSVAIEEVIRTRYRDSSHELDQRIFRAILPYLQELLYQVSYGYTQFPQNYQALVTSLLRLKEVIFVSLNYDLLLDNVLASVDLATASIDWYTQSDRHWSLIKLHGSVNWGRQTGVGAGVFLDPPADLELADDIVVRPADPGDLWNTRGFSSRGGSYVPGQLFYPVLSVPIGEANLLACPQEHVAFLGKKLEETQPLHLLLVGYSGVDREVFSLIRDSGRGVKTLTIVDRSSEAAGAVAERILREHEIAADEVYPFDGDFNKWVESGELGRFVEDMSSRRPQKARRTSAWVRRVTPPPQLHAAWPRIEQANLAFGFGPRRGAGRGT
jgi:hypothetical protein